MIKKIAGIGLIAMAVLAGGCASVPMASDDKDMAAKSFAPKADKASVYVYRNETMGAAVKLPVVLNGKLVGDTASKTYFLLEVAPGKHELVSKGEKDSALSLEVQGGRNYFVWQEIKMGMFGPNTLLQLVDEGTGKAGVAECKLIDTTQ